MKQNFNSLILLLLLIFVGCTVENMPTEEPVEPSPTAIPSPTFLPTKTPASTATLYLTPLPTLSREETFNHLFVSENTCDVPCWWGIIPGISPWQETKQFIEQFSEMSFGVHKTGGVKHITNAQPSETYVWYIGNPVPNTDYSTTVYLEVQNNIVTALEIGPELVWYFFPIHKLLETYGQPDEVLIGNSQYYVDSSTFYARIYLLYKDKHIFTSYGYSGSRGTNPIGVCLYEYGEGFMFLWSSEGELDFDFSQLKSLQEFSEQNPANFHERFANEKNKCLEISEDAWK